MTVPWALWALGASAGALSLDEARAVAVERALGVQRRAAEAEAAEGGALAAMSGNLPELAAFGSISPGAGFTSFGIPRPPSTQLGAGLTASWRVLDPGGWASASAARRTARGQAALADLARVTARRDATVAYADALEAEESLAALARSAADAERAAAAVGSLAGAGFRPDADRARAAAVAAALSADRLASEGEVAARCASLQSLLGLDIDGQCALAPAVWGEPAEAVGAHPALVAASEALEAARAARLSTVLDRAPALSGEATAGTYLAVRPGEETTSGPGWSAQLRLDVPLLASGGGVGRLAEATGGRDAAAVALEAQRRELEVARISAEARHRGAQAAVSARQTALEAASEALGLVDARYREGLDDLEAWLAARRVRDDALLAMARARAELGRALAEVEAVRGVTGP